MSEKLESLVEQELSDSDSDVTAFMWPFPNACWRDKFFPQIVNMPEIQRVYTAVGEEGMMSLRQIHQRHNNLESLDYSLDRPVLSSDVPELVEEGVVPAIDFEYARDVAMDLKYNDRGVYDVARDSYDMLSENGFLVYDLHDFGPHGLYTDSEIQSEVDALDSLNAMEKLLESKNRHVEHFKQALEEVFPRVESYACEDSYKTHYLLASK